MKSWALLLISAISLPATAIETLKSGLFGDRQLERPVDAGSVPAYEQPAPISQDISDTAMLSPLVPEGKTLLTWYKEQSNPKLVLYFDRRLEGIPPGWQGSTRLLIEHSRNNDGKQDNGQVSIGIQKNTAQSISSERSDIIRLIEQSLLRELQRREFKLIDPILVERIHTSNKGANGDHEFDSLKGTAKLLLDVQLAASGTSLHMLANLKDLQSGELLAAIEIPVENSLAVSKNIDATTKKLMKKLTSFAPMR
jgi:hypothetical protein